LYRRDAEREKGGNGQKLGKEGNFKKKQHNGSPEKREIVESREMDERNWGESQ